MATGTVLLGDKQEADKYKQYNAGHVPDLIKPGDSAWGTDWLGESKVPSPLRASAPPPGCQRMGHTHGFGSTEEPLRRTVFGCRERGLPSGPRLDHTTGEGHVPFHKGDYHDALRHKNNQVALLLVECFGGIASGGARLLRYLARRASDKKRGRDGTKYSKFHPRGTSRTTSRRSAWRRSTRTPRTSPTASSASSSARWPRATPLSERPTTPTPSADPPGSAGLRV